MTASDISNAALLLLAGAGFAQALTWLLHVHRHRWILHSHSITRHVLGLTFDLTACLRCERCGARKLIERGKLDKPQSTWLYSRDQALVWLRSQCVDQVPSLLPESIEAPTPPKGAA